MNQFGLMKVGTAIPPVHIAHPEANRLQIEQLAQRAFDAGVSVLVFPELCLTGCSCGDLFFQNHLLNEAERALTQLIRRSRDWPGLLLFVGLPVVCRHRLLNCAAAVKDGKLTALIPKTHLSDAANPGEERHFVSGADPLFADRPQVCIGGQTVALGQTLIRLTCGEETFAVGAEIGADLWAPAPVSTGLALSGARIIVNLAADHEQIGRADYRRTLVGQQSARLNCAYLYAAAGPDESTTDTVCGGHCLIAENGKLSAERPAFSAASIDILDYPIDLELLAHARRKNPAFSAAAPTVPDVNGGAVTTGKEPLIARRRIEAHPFVPADKEERNRHCQEVLTIQAHGLSRRLRHINCQTTVIGISGGLDSTLALLATCEAYRLNDWSLKGIIGITMPGFGTTDRTLANALQLMEELGITIRQIPISAAVRQHFQDIGHDPALKDITYENSQARERTQILMDVANQVGGLVIGTGDLSELALGWCTYNGDHMSMYGLNGAVPKTLLRSIVRFVAEQQPGSRISELLLNILDTPISPELLPPNEEGQITQHTEDSTGPYELHDFFIYHTVKNGFTPRKIYALAVQVFTQPAVPATAESGPGLSREQYDADTILHWLKIFYRRFFGQQFKRSAMPDGPKIGSIGFSPRGAWQMPSDADVTAWTEDLDSF